MAVIWFCAEGVDQKETRVGEIPLERCVKELQLKQQQHICGLEEQGPQFGNADDLMGLNRRGGQHVVVQIDASEASDGWIPGYYWLPLAPEEVQRRIGL